MGFRKETLAEGVEVWLGDCREVLPTLIHVNHMVMDPPFEKEAHTPTRRTQKSIRDDEPAELGFDAITDELRAFLPAWAKTHVDGWFLAFCQVEAVSKWRDVIEKAEVKYKRGMAWVKPDSSPQFNGQMPAQGYECIVAAWCGAGHSVWNAGGKRGVYTHLTNPRDRHGVHPTEKPLALMGELIADFTKPGDLICDPFCGSASTGVAAIKAGRRFIGIEQNPVFFDVAVERLTKALKQPDMFVATPAPLKQSSMFDPEAA